MSGFIVNENLIEDNINNNKYKTKKKKILDAAIIFLASVFLVCIFFIGRYFWQSLRNNGLNEDLANDAVSYGDSQINQEDSQGDSNNNNDTDSVSTSGNAVTKVPESINFDKLKAQNKDVVGWIFSKNGVINYPILQGDDNSYYLNHLISGKKNMNGSIFMDYSANSNFKDANTLIYGHSMDNGSMFRSLLNYKKQSYYDKYPEFYIYTPTGNYKLLIFAAYESKSNDIAYGKIYGETGFNKLVANAVSKSRIKTNVEVGVGDKLVTLSTCAYSSKNARFLVMGKLVPFNWSSTDSTDIDASENGSNGFASSFWN